MKRYMERLYCLTRCADGRWLLLNRNYKPFGQGSDDWVDYDTCPGIRLTLSEQQVHRLSGGSAPYRTGDRRAWLYHDGTQPDRSSAHLVLYLQRLAILDLMERAS